MKIIYKILFGALFFSIILINNSVLHSEIMDSFEVRSIDGTGNNPKHPEYGSVGEVFLRLSKSDTDRYCAPSGRNRKSAREISNIVAAQEESILNENNLSDFVWLWGQFLDHDIDLALEALPPEAFDIEVPFGDRFFDPYEEGDKFIFFNRTETNNMCEQVNSITSFIDASNVYGSDDVRASALRTFIQGKLKTSSGNLLPYNIDGLPNAGGPDPKLFLGGDVRANEQIALTAMHTIFVREHNRLCDEIANEHPHYTLNDEDIYQWVRKIVGAQMQIITYKEFLPLLLGPDALPSYRGFNSKVNPCVTNEFATAAYRFGHSMLSPSLLRLNRPGNVSLSTSLKDAFFNPQLIRKIGGIDALVRGAAYQQSQEIDNKIVDGVRNFLFGEPGGGGFDLAALNIQRGRDHGLADYNKMRKALGLKRCRYFYQISTDPDVQRDLAEAYSEINDMDLWAVGLAEDHVPDAIVGPTFWAILKDQFLRLRDGDRFYYLNDPFFTSNPVLLDELESTKLSDIIRRNTNVGDELHDNVFLAH